MKRNTIIGFIVFGLASAVILIAIGARFLFGQLEEVSPLLDDFYAAYNEQDYDFIYNELFDDKLRCAVTLDEVRSQFDDIFVAHGAYERSHTMGFKMHGKSADDIQAVAMCVVTFERGQGSSGFFCVKQSGDWYIEAYQFKSDYVQVALTPASGEGRQCPVR